MATCKTDTKLKSLELYTEHDEFYYLRAVYEKTNEHEKIRITIPKIMLPIYNDRYLICDEPDNYPRFTINMGIDPLPIIQEDNMAYFVETVEEYPQKMTLDEIEKELGYKIELVGEEDNGNR